MTRQQPAAMAVRPFGDRALLITDPPGSVADLARELDRMLPQAMVVGGLASVLVEFSAGLSAPSAGELADLVLALASPHRSPNTADNQHVIEVHYNGVDLELVADALGCSPAGVISAHQDAQWVVAAVGFAPGFAYLSCDDPRWLQVSRRADPRPAVPAGSVAVAAGLAGIYPSSSPGGWQLLGTTRVRMFDPTQERPALLAVGDRVRFVAVP